MATRRKTAKKTARKTAKKARKTVKRASAPRGPSAELKVLHAIAPAIERIERKTNRIDATVNESKNLLRRAKKAKRIARENEEARLQAMYN